VTGCRIKAGARTGEDGGMRVNASGATVLRHGELFYDRVGKTAEMNGHALALSDRERTLLEIFMQEPRRMVTKAQIIDLLGERGDAVSANAVEVYVHRLRKKLEAGGVKIYTARGLGYCLDPARTS
jgi:two-component system, OmpR family, response regulator